MQTTLYLSKVLGIGLVITGAAIMLRWRYFIPVFSALVEQRLLRAIVAMIELLAGLFLIAAHNHWSPPAAAIVSALGWIAALEGTALLVLPDGVVEKWIGAFNVRAWYLVGGLLSLAAGLYLAGFGFGWW